MGNMHARLSFCSENRILCLILLKFYWLLHTGDIKGFHFWYIIVGYMEDCNGEQTFFGENVVYLSIKSLL